MKHLKKVALAVLASFIIWTSACSGSRSIGGQIAPAVPVQNLSAILTQTAPMNYSGSAQGGAGVVSGNVFNPEQFFEMYGNTACYGRVPIQSVLKLMGKDLCYLNGSGVGTLMAQSTQVQSFLSYYDLLGRLFPSVKQASDIIAKVAPITVLHHFDNGDVALCEGAGLNSDLHPNQYGGSLLLGGRANSQTGVREGGYCQSDCVQWVNGKMGPSSVPFGQVANGKDCRQERFERDLGVQPEPVPAKVDQLARLSPSQLQVVGDTMARLYGGRFVPQVEAVLRQSPTSYSQLEYLTLNGNSGFGWKPIVANRNTNPSITWQSGYFFGIDGNAYYARVDSSSNYSATISSASNPVVLNSLANGVNTTQIWMGRDHWEFSDSWSYNRVYPTLRAMGMNQAFLDSLNPAIMPANCYTMACYNDAGQRVNGAGKPIYTPKGVPITPAMVPVFSGTGALGFASGEIIGVSPVGSMQPIFGMP